MPVLPLYRHAVSGEQRGRLLSAGGGVAVAFVFMQLVPELAERRDPVRNALDAVPLLGDVHEFALLGLLLFYGIEVLARKARNGHGRSRLADQLAIGTFAAYYLLIGTFLWQQAARGPGMLALYAVAMALHFVVIDYGLRRHHFEAYTRLGRWILAVALLAGWAIGGWAAVPEAAEGLLLALLAGAVVLVALKEELPAEQRGRFTWFAAGALAYGALVGAL